MKTTLSIDGERFRINGRLVYSEIPGSAESVHGLLMNARLIQGVFDDKAAPERFARFGWDRWDPERHTDELIAALPEWYAYGLRAFTVGLQGGMPVFTIDNDTIDCNPFSADGSRIDERTLARLDRLIRAADAIGMAVIVSILYQGQAPRMGDGASLRRAVRRASRWLADQGFTNVIIEPANEHTVGAFKRRPMMASPDAVTGLIEIAREASGGMPVGCSEGGVEASREVAEASDVVLVHGNGSHRQQYYRFLRRVRGWGLGKPIVCNEDSPCFTQLDVAFETRTSWGYYNNHTKQEPPAAWGIANAEDLFFARRMARGLGIPVAELPEEERYVLLGPNDRWEWKGERWIRLAAEFPETVRSVEFFHNGERVDVAWEEPFYVNEQTTWIQLGSPTRSGDRWKAVVHLADGRVLERSAVQR
jgi:hypothetical protein